MDVTALLPVLVNHYKTFTKIKQPMEVFDKTEDLNRYRSMTSFDLALNKSSYAAQYF